jgi:hypothetical protein
MALAPTETFFDEILEFLASSPTPTQIVDFQPPVALQQRLSEMLEKNRTVRLTEADRHELAEFVSMNRFMSRLKLKARQRLHECGRPTSVRHYDAR